MKTEDERGYKKRDKKKQIIIRKEWKYKIKIRNEEYKWQTLEEIEKYFDFINIDDMLYKQKNI